MAFIKTDENLNLEEAFRRIECGLGRRYLYCLARQYHQHLRSSTLDSGNNFPSISTVEPRIYQSGSKPATMNLSSTCQFSSPHRTPGNPRLRKRPPCASSRRGSSLRRSRPWRPWPRAKRQARSPPCPPLARTRRARRCTSTCPGRASRRRRRC